jgi:signal transduction histidine kinase
MRKKIIVGLAVYSLVFLLCGVYIIITIESARAKLGTLLTLHQVEILREHFLIQIKRVQSDLSLRDTPYERGFDAAVTNIMNMERIVDECSACHHSAEVAERIEDLSAQTNRYKEALSRVLTMRANAARLAVEEDNAFRIGEELGERVGTMIAITSSRLEERTSKALGEIAQTKYILYVLVGVGPFLSVGLALVFLGGFTRPLNSLLEATRKLKGGDLDHRVEGLADEFGELGASFNEMAYSLKKQMHQMQRTEQMAALGTLSSGISHELSTPLSVILNMAQLARQDMQGNPALVKDLEVIEYEANQAIKIIRSLLGFARSTKAKTEEVHVNDVLESLFKIIEFQPQAKSIRLVRELDPDLPPVLAGTGQLRQVFLNVILNAIQAMPQGGELKVVTRTRADHVFDGVEIVVSDTGVGIPRHQIERIFQPFFTTKEEGTGLGLAITYGIVREHNGRIDVESAVGRGTTFRIFLPRSAERMPA